LDYLFTGTSHLFPSNIVNLHCEHMRKELCSYYRSQFIYKCIAGSNGQYWWFEM